MAVQDGKDSKCHSNHDIQQDAHQVEAAIEAIQPVNKDSGRRRLGIFLCHFCRAKKMIFHDIEVQFSTQTQLTQSNAVINALQFNHVPEIRKSEAVDLRDYRDLLACRV